MTYSWGTSQQDDTEQTERSLYIDRYYTWCNIIVLLLHFKKQSQLFKWHTKWNSQQDETARSLALAALAYGLIITPKETTLCYAVKWQRFIPAIVPTWLCHMGGAAHASLSRRTCSVASTCLISSQPTAWFFLGTSIKLHLDQRAFEPFLISACARPSDLKQWQPPCHAGLMLEVKDRMAWRQLPENRRMGGKKQLVFNLPWKRMLTVGMFEKPSFHARLSADDSLQQRSLAFQVVHNRFLEAKDAFTC